MDSEFYKYHYVDFIVVHWNVQGILQKMDEINFLSDKFESSVICICEHWEHLHNLAYLVIPGFILVSAYHRPLAKRGSTAIFLKSDLSYRELTFLVNLSIASVCEVAAVYICLEIYRVPCHVNFDSYVDA